MNISSLSSMFQAQFVAEERQPHKRAPLQNGSGQGDTVSFSEEALALARAHTQKTAEAGSDPDTAKDEDGKAKSGVSGGEGAAGYVNGKGATEKEKCSPKFGQV